MALTTLEEHACFGGVQGFYEHASDEIGLPMRFGVYLPPQAAQGPVPVLYYLAGLTCNEQTFAIKAGAQQHAAQHGLMLVTPDTSPRNTGVAGADKDWDFGTGAGFYLDATQEPYARTGAWRATSPQELPQVLAANFRARPARRHLRPLDGRPRRADAGAAASGPVPQRLGAGADLRAQRSAVGPEGLHRLPGRRPRAWAQHDAVQLIAGGARTPPLLVDQGLADQFLASQLRPELLEAGLRRGRPAAARCAGTRATTTATSSSRQSSGQLSTAYMKPTAQTCA
jgi:S-formylglutathione hydrolase